jgi:hypothetical protein
MSADRTLTCAYCGAEISPEVPEYFIELESFRLISESEGKTPRRGSREYREAMEKLTPDIREAYYKNIELYDHGHLWCPVCGGRLSDT